MDRISKIRRITFIGAAVNVSLFLLKLCAGIVGGSSAMIADAMHSLSDLATDILVVVSVHFASQPEDDGHDFGHGKIETVCTVLIGCVLLSVGVGLLYGGSVSVSGVFKGVAVRVPGWSALAAAVISIVSKELLYRRAISVAMECGSSALAANAWHYRADVFSSVAVFLGIAGAMIPGGKWSVLDPIAAMFVSVFIVKAAYDLVRPGIDELVEKSLPSDIKDEIVAIVKSVAGDCDPHNLRTRRIGPYVAIEVHIRLPALMTVSAAHEITRGVENELRERFGGSTHVIVHVEPFAENAA